MLLVVHGVAERQGHRLFRAHVQEHAIVEDCIVMVTHVVNVC